MERTIMIKGVGVVSVKPDLIVLSMSLKSKDKDYEKSILLATKQVEELRLALVSVGFHKESLKTLDFDIITIEKRVKDKDGEYRYDFDGYECKHRLKLEFGLDTKVLGKVLSAIATCSAMPALSINFSVKDSHAVSVEILKRATQNAKQKAEILCESAGVKLGQLVTIDYNWGEIEVTSHAKYLSSSKECASTMALVDMDIAPEDIEAGDTATFVWEII